MSDSPHMTPEEFRPHGRELADWVADYMERVGSLPVHAQVEPGRDPRATPGFRSRGARAKLSYRPAGAKSAVSRLI